MDACGKLGLTVGGRLRGSQMGPGLSDGRRAERALVCGAGGRERGAAGSQLDAAGAQQAQVRETRQAAHRVRAREDKTGLTDPEHVTCLGCCACADGVVMGGAA